MTKKNDINIEISWDKNVVPENTKIERSLLIDLTTKSDSIKTKKDRPPVNLALVIDRSGSMDGSPLEAAKSAAKQITKKLNSGDRLSLVSFDTETKSHFSNIKMDSKGASFARGVINELYAGSMTNLSGGWFEGARCVTEAIDHGNFNDGFVIVLSDGMANVGITDPKELKLHATELSSRGIQTSSIGIGAHYSPLQLDALALGGGGRLHDTETAGDIIEVVLGELGEIGNTFARNLKLYIHSPSSIQLECLSKIPGESYGNFFQVDVGSLQLDQTRSIALLVKTDSQDKGSELPIEVHITWEDIEKGEQIESTVVSTILKVVGINEFKNTPINTNVTRKIADLWEASLAYRAMILNEQNRFDKAKSIYDKNMLSYSQIVDCLDDSASRVDRFKSTQDRVAREWIGRSKRGAFNLSKKLMMGQSDLRQRDTGSWHDEIES